jgi:hypothetical protein
MAAERNIFIRQGNTFTHAIILWDGVVDGVKTPADLSGYTFASEIREAGETPFSNSGSLFYNENETLSSTFESVIDGNQVIFTLSSERAEIIPPGRHWYDIQQIDDQDRQTTLLSGTVVVLPEIA